MNCLYQSLALTPQLALSAMPKIKCQYQTLSGRPWGCKLATKTLPVGTIKALTPGYGRPMDYHCHDDYNQRQIDLTTRSAICGQAEV